MVFNLSWILDQFGGLLTDAFYLVFNHSGISGQCPRISGQGKAVR